ncbi:hypothetical protein AB0H28_16640 [Micromonospora sp. NPDC050980]|uniref:hypothetical protein n=1 Tax=Micromonospora sp. NPDC050980 TaxID=3155161 RepID=UPI0033DAABB1
MTRRFGDRATFAVKVGGAKSLALGVVDLWAAGALLTAHDNWTVLPRFCAALRSTAALVRQGEVAPCPYPGCRKRRHVDCPGRTPEENFRRLHGDQSAFRERFLFLQWGETVDNVSKYAYLNDGGLVLVFAFWRADHPHPQPHTAAFAVARVTAVSVRHLARKEVRIRSTTKWWEGGGLGQRALSGTLDPAWRTVTSGAMR